MADNDRGADLLEGVDFEYAYAANTAAGMATVSIIGKGNYTGSVDKTF